LSAPRESGFSQAGKQVDVDSSGALTFVDFVTPQVVVGQLASAARGLQTCATVQHVQDPQLEGATCTRHTVTFQRSPSKLSPGPWRGACLTVLNDFGALKAAGKADSRGQTERAGLGLHRCTGF
jgi:hypothetical protein